MADGEQCGVHDFSFSDLTKPTHPRLVKIFSYIINFVRFRESQSETMDKYFRLFEDTQSRIETVYTENQELAARLAHLRTNQSALKAQAKAKNERIDELKSKLFTLKKDQERLQTDMDRTRSQKSDLAKTLQDRVDRTQHQRHEAEKLRPYASQSTAALQAQLSELADTLARDKAQAENLEKRARALQTSMDTFSLAANDIQPLITLLRSAAQDLGAEEAETLDAQRRRDALTERSNNVREVERTEAMLQKQLARWVERTEAVRAQAKERADAARERMEALKEEHRKLAAERGERGREVERRRVRIEQTEKKVNQLMHDCVLSG
jgi:kinetochore protein Nuf2